MGRTSARQTTTKIGKYQLLERAGQGSAGTVFKGQDPDNGQLVAVKILAEKATADPVLRMRFAQECQITRKLNHPHLVRVLDYGLDGSKPYLVMEYVPGESLGRRLERAGRLPEAEAVGLITQVGLALHWAHLRRLVHRDVKPDNILVTPEGIAKLADLGLVKDASGEFDLTQPLSGLGTPNFMAPEQFEDARAADALCDLYSLAATLYMLVTGEVPFRAHSTHAIATILQKKLTNDLTDPRQLAPELSARTATELLRALHPDRQVRHASVQEFLEALTDPPASTPVEPAVVAVRVSLPETATRENRRRQRYPSQRGTLCKPLQLGESWEGKVVDISQTGLCLQINRRFEKGTLLTIVLEGNTSRRRSLLVRIVWVKRQSPEHWKLGCTLDQPLCEAELQEFS